MKFEEYLAEAKRQDVSKELQAHKDAAVKAHADKDDYAYNHHLAHVAAYEYIRDQGGSSKHDALSRAKNLKPEHRKSLEMLVRSGDR